MVSTQPSSTSRLPHHASGDAPGPWAQRMRSVLDERVALLGELDAASARQDEVIASRDTQALLELVTIRQRIVDRFVAGQSELLALTEGFESQVSAVEPAEAETLRSLLRVLSEGLARITARDEVAQDALRQARDETRGELLRTNTAGGARSAYRNATHVSGRDAADGARFADRRA